MTGIGDWTQDIHQGDAGETLAEMPESSVHCTVTSPAYFRQRDYGIEGQLGLEGSLGEYIDSLVEVGEELRRVLRPDGSWWLNLGDTFAGSNNGRSFQGDTKETPTPGNRPSTGTLTFQKKQKMLVPHRVAIALQESGWVVRQDNVWAKTNPIPNPVQDRHTETKEYVFHLTPAPHYWFDLDAIRQEPKEASIERSQRGYNGTKTTEVEHMPGGELESRAHNFDRGCHPNGKNPGDIWEHSTSNFPETHFAVFPEDLPEDPIKASCPPEVCVECGMGYHRDVEETPLWELDVEDINRPQKRRAVELFEKSDLTVEHLEAAKSLGFGDGAHGKAAQGTDERLPPETLELAREAKDVLEGYFREFVSAGERTFNGWKQACDCETDETEPGIVLDPFAGAGTTCLVAKRFGRRFVGIDLNPEFVAMAQRRVGLTIDEPELIDDIAEMPEDPLTAFADGGES